MTKELLKNNVLMRMRFHLDSSTLDILGNVLIEQLRSVEIVEVESLPATVDNTNDYIMELYRTVKAPRLAEETVKKYEDLMRRFIAYVNKPLNRVCSMDIDCFLKDLSPTNGATSLNNKRRVLSSFFSWMRKMRLIPENPVDLIDPFKETVKPIDHLLPEEWEKLKTGCLYKRDRAIIEFLRCTAMRGGEVPLVRICDIDWRTGRLTIYGRKSRTYRLVMLDSVALEYIQEYLEERGVRPDSTEPLFVHLRGNTGEHLSKNGICKAVKAIGARAGLRRNVYTHLFRKTTATNIVRRGGSDEMAGEYLGHAPKGVTGRHYTFKGEGHVCKIFEDYVAAV